MKIFNKSFLTNFLALILSILGYYLPSHIILNIGLFALSGALTNYLAIYMIFEKVPFIYGSGVIVNKFEEFKEAIYSLIMDEFFKKENIIKFFEARAEEGILKEDFSKVLERLDFDIAFTSLKDTILESSFGSMLNMFGGVSVLEPLKKPFISKLKQAIVSILGSKAFQEILFKKQGGLDFGEELQKKISKLVKDRLDELSPLMVKQMIQKIIREHLSWLVLWGGVFGGIIGLLSAFVS